MSVLTVDLELNGEDLSTAVAEALVLDVRRPLVGKRRHTRVEIPGRAGSVTFDEEPGDRVLEIVIDLEAATFEDRRDAVRRLARWAEVGTSSQLIISDEPDRYHDAILENADTVLERLLYGAATLRFAVGPYSLASTPSTQTENATSNPDSDTFNITDDVYAEPVIELTPAGGTLTGFTLTVNGSALTWTGDTILAGETLTISSISDTITIGENEDVDLTGAFDEEDVSMADVSGTFPLLFSGANAWSLSRSGTATSVSIVFTWRERFR